MLDEEGKQHGVQPCFNAATAQKFFYHQDYKDFQAPQWLSEAPSPSYPFLEGPFTLEEFEGVIKRVNVSSAPNPLDQITYRVLCQCHSLWPALLNLFNACWEQHCVPSLWKRGVIRLIPKAAANEAPHLPANLRPIALTSCVGKVYTAMLKNRRLQFMLQNRYLDTTVQKAFLPGVPGCMEHYQKLSTIIKDAHKSHRSLSVCWLHLANAYGSVHHQLIHFCLKHYHAPQAFLKTIANIYTDISAIIT